MSKPLAAKGVGACLKHVLYTRLSPARLDRLGEPGMDVELKRFRRVRDRACIADRRS
jgi:hypothetical protein